MKKIDDGHEGFREKARDLRLEPSIRVWDRLESRLDQDIGKVRSSVVKLWIGVAASLLVVLASVYYLNRSQPSTTFANLEELQDITHRPSFAVYHQVSDVNAAYKQGNWQQIKEGSNKKLRQGGDLKMLDFSAQGDTL